MSCGRSCCKVFTVSLVPATVFILSVVFFCGIIVLPALYTELVTKEQYGIVIDAGSTHTHIYLYKWRATSQNSTAKNVRQFYDCQPKGGGITNYTDPVKAVNSIYLCLKGILSHVPSDYKNDVKVWFGATAGMRLLRLENETLAQEILKNVRKTLKHFKIQYHDTRILSSRVEGDSGWISVNYIMNKLQTRNPKNGTLGALDMGGASTQITFEHSAVTNYSLNMTLFGRNYTTYSRSYLCFGVVEAFRRTLAYLAKGNESNIISNPCLPASSTSMNYSSDFLFTGHTCTADLVPKTIPKNREFAFKGTSNPSQCQSIIAKAMNFSLCVVNGSLVPDCGGDKLPDVSNKTFVGFSNFYNIAKFFNRERSLLNRTQLENFTKEVQSFCGRDWKNITANYNHMGNNYLKCECFDGMYLIHTLTEGFGLSSNKGNWTISLTDTSGDVKIGWALGYMLNNTNHFAVKPNVEVYPYSSTDLIVGMLVLTILTIVFVVFFLFTFSACRKALKPIATGYTNIS